VAVLVTTFRRFTCVRLVNIAHSQTDQGKARPDHGQTGINLCAYDSLEGSHRRVELAIAKKIPAGRILNVSLKAQTLTSQPSTVDLGIR